MTREEAIEVIKRRQKCPECVKYHNCDACDRDYDKALEMAIEVLKADPCEDCVSRAWIREHLGEFLQGCRAERTYEEIAEDVEAYIDHAPPVTPKPNFCASCKHNVGNEVCLECEYDGTTRGMTRYEPITPKQRTGKIIMGGYDCDHYICSECGHDFGWFSKPDYKYCPNCGAKMEGVSE